jgi:hypothetical protein
MVGLASAKLLFSHRALTCRPCFEPAIREELTMLQSEVKQVPMAVLSHLELI